MISILPPSASTYLRMVLSSERLSSPRSMEETAAWLMCKVMRVGAMEERR
jgi:hypothetical protein